MLSEYPLHSPQVSRLQQKRSYEGLGTFWAVLALTQSTDYAIPSDTSTLEALSFQLRISSDELTNFLADCIDARLVIYNDDAQQYEFPVMRDKRMKRRKAGRKSGQVRGSQQEKNIVQQELNIVQHEKNGVQQPTNGVEHEKTLVEQPLPPHTPPSPDRDINTYISSRAKSNEEKAEPPDPETARQWALEDLPISAAEATELVTLWHADRSRKSWNPSAQPITDWRADLRFFHTSNTRHTPIRAPDRKPPPPALAPKAENGQSLREFINKPTSGDDA